MHQEIIINFFMELLLKIPRVEPIKQNDGVLINSFHFMNCIFVK